MAYRLTYTINDDGIWLVCEHCPWSTCLGDATLDAANAAAQAHDPEHTPPPPPAPSQGWGFPGNSRKAHYFVVSVSLCRRWYWLGGPDLEDDSAPSPDDCAACRRAFDKRQPDREVTT